MKAPPYTAASVDVVRLPRIRRERDSVAVEEPLEIRVNGAPVAVTMRTPGHDEELALGFLVSEGIRPRRADMPEDLAANTVEVEADGFDPARLERHFFTSSSCGVCGKGALEAVQSGAFGCERSARLA
jgi:FdhD protein